MNICPGCASEMEQGRELCESCGGEAVEPVMDASVACLEFEDGQRFPLDREETLLGRSDPIDRIEPDVDLSYTGGFEQGVSRRHAVITWTGEEFRLEDLGSTNGTIHNRQKVQPGAPVPLAEGDVLYFGHMKAVFHAGQAGGGVS